MNNILKEKITYFFKKTTSSLWIKILFCSSLFFLLLVVVYIQSSRSNNSENSPPSDALYFDVNLSDEERIDNLLSYMSLEEKIGQMALIEKNSVKDLKDLQVYGLGGILSGGGAGPKNNTPEDWRKMVKGFVDSSLNSRLGIPILYGADSVNGNGNVFGATFFPHFIGLGATQDNELIEQVAQATAKESLAMGIRWSYSPNLDMPQDIRWGRVYEGFSDDPVRVGEHASAYLRGLHQVDENKKRLSVLGTAKHYIGIGSMRWGESTGETYLIDQGVTPVSESALRNEYLPPFKKVVDQGALSVMAGLNMWGDTKLSANEYLLNDVLKGELGFKGFVVSDWYGVYEVSDSKYNSLVLSINAGIDMVMLPYDYKPFVIYMKNAVTLGDISTARIDDAVRRILRAKFALGLFDKKIKFFEDIDVVGSKAHHELAREAVQKSLVLLKNEENILPISREISHIRVAGSGADNIGRQSGGWTLGWQGTDGNNIPDATSILTGIKQTVSNETLVEYSKDGYFASGPVADIGIVVVSEKPYAEGVGDNPNPKIDDADLAAIRNISRVSKKVIVIILSGRPLIITEEIQSWNGAVAAWLLGSQGLGVADVIFGMRPFTGKLPLPWPRSIDQLPIGVNGKTTDGSKVLFERGFGL